MPTDERMQEQIGVMLERELRAQERIAKARQTLHQIGLAEPTYRYQSTREVYESNRLENLGPDLAGTWNIMSSKPAKELERTFDISLFQSSLTADADINAVLGLQGARLLARRLQDSGDTRAWSEMDLRSLHSTICAGESYAGVYKRYHVRIGGEGSHEPHLPTDVSAAMHNLVTWWDGAQGSGIVKAAIVHAWLTHIHPFEDGNGRLARILANVTLNRCGLAPAIVKHSTQRGAYLDALRHSDYGGDIFPLADLFLGTVTRYAREIDRPRALRKIFLEELQRREDGKYGWWNHVLTEFLGELNAAVALKGLTVWEHGRLDYDSFQQLEDLKPTRDSWLQSIVDSEAREVLFWFGYPSINMRQEDEYFPSIFLAVPSEPWNVRRYRLPDTEETNGISEIMLIPATQTSVYVMRDGRRRVGNIREAAEYVADFITAAFRAEVVPKRWPFGSEQRPDAESDV
jgi:Fic family protein